MKKEDAPVGTMVRCVDPANFMRDLERKLRNRVGVIERFQIFGGLPIIRFPAEGRRKEFVWVPPNWYHIEKAEQA